MIDLSFKGLRSVLARIDEDPSLPFIFTMAGLKLRVRVEDIDPDERLDTIARMLIAIGRRAETGHVGFRVRHDLSATGHRDYFGLEFETASGEISVPCELLDIVTLAPPSITLTDTSGQSETVALRRIVL